MKPNVILWDWDNTLVNTRNVAKKALFRLGSETDVSVSDADVTEVIGGHLVDFWFRHYGSDPIPFVRKFVDYYRELSYEATLFPETIGILNWVRDKGIPQMVVSNKNQDILTAEAERFGIADYFQKIVGTVNQGIGKPSREFADKVLGSVWPEKIVMIGDGQSDMAFAETLGAYGILIGESDQPAYPCDTYIHSLNKISDILEI